MGMVACHDPDSYAAYGPIAGGFWRNKPTGCAGPVKLLLTHVALSATKAGVEGTSRFRVHAPLIRLTKAEIIRRGVELGVDYGMTHSCYAPDATGASTRPSGK